VARFLASVPHYHITLFTKDDWGNPNVKFNNQDLIVISVPIAITEKTIHQATESPCTGSTGDRLRLEVAVSSKDDWKITTQVV
jgi:hypothetical protein